MLALNWNGLGYAREGGMMLVLDWNGVGCVGKEGC